MHNYGRMHSFLEERVLLSVRSFNHESISFLLLQLLITRRLYECLEILVLQRFKAASKSIGKELIIFFPILDRLGHAVKGV